MIVLYHSLTGLQNDNTLIRSDVGLAPASEKPQTRIARFCVQQKWLWNNDRKWQIYYGN